MTTKERHDDRIEVASSDVSRRELVEEIARWLREDGFGEEYIDGRSTDIPGVADALEKKFS